MPAAPRRTPPPLRCAHAKCSPQGPCLASLTLEKVVMALLTCRPLSWQLLGRLASRRPAAGGRQR